MSGETVGYSFISVRGTNWKIMLNVSRSGREFPGGNDTVPVFLPKKETR